MKIQTALKIVFFVALVGVAFSGYLSYTNIWGQGCQHALISCGGSKPVKIFGQPTCVYGFFMFLLVAILALSGWVSKNKFGLLRTILVIGIIGTLFSLSLSVYELWFLNNTINGLPACVYGFFIYAAILIITITGSSNKSILPAIPTTPTTPTAVPPTQQ